MKWPGLVFAVLATLAVTASAQDEDAEDDHMGLTEYEISCMPCHGRDGRGDGPMANGLAKKPADLTQIAKANGGVFPVKKVTAMIDGRAAVIAHGAREMPVWGARYRTSDDPQDTPSDIDKRARALIAALVEYLTAIQEH